MIIGMFNPRLVLPKGIKNRKRKQVFTMYIPLLLIFFISFVSVAPELTLEEKRELEVERIEKNIKKEEVIQAKKLEALNKRDKQHQEALEMEESLKKQQEKEEKEKQLEEMALKKKEENAEIKRKEEEKIKEAAELAKKQKELKLKTELEKQSKIDNQYTIRVTPKQFLKVFNSALKDNGLDMKAEANTKDKKFNLTFSNGKDQFDGILAHGLLNKDDTIRALYFHPNASSTFVQDNRYVIVYMYTITSMIEATNTKISTSDANSILDQINSEKSIVKNGIQYEYIEKINVDGEKLELPGGSFLVKSANDNATIELNNNVMEFKGYNIQR